MNIKMDRKTRIRLRQDEVFRFASEGNIAQEFSLGLLKFKIELHLDPSASSSYIRATENGMSIVLCGRDSEIFLRGKGKGAEFCVDNVWIQIDSWSTEKRNRNENDQEPFG